MKSEKGIGRKIAIILAMVAAISMTMFVVSCQGDTSSELPSVSLEEENKVFAADEEFPEYTQELPETYTVHTLRVRRDELSAGIIGDKSIKGYKKLFMEASKDTDVLEESKEAYDPDPNNAKFNELLSKVNFYIGETRDGANIPDEDLAAAAALLYEDHDLNGLYGIYRTAYRFYSNYVYSPKDLSVEGNGGYLSVDSDNLASYKRKEIIKQAKLVLGRNLKITSSVGDAHLDCTIECNASYAEEYVENFRQNQLKQILAENELQKNKLADAQITLKFYYDLLYVSGKYEDETVNAQGLTAAQKVYGGETAEIASQKALSSYKISLGSMSLIFKSLAQSDTDLESRLSEELKKYFEQATVEKGLETYVTAAAKLVNGFGKTANIEKTDTDTVREEKIDAKIDELKLIETYVNHFESLEPYTLNLSGGEKIIDLKTVSEDTDSVGSDWNRVRVILNKSVGLTKDAITAIKTANADKYGISADATVNYNINIAYGLADKLISRSGENSSNYSAAEIALGFKRSYASDGALSNGTERTKSIAWFKNVASLSYRPSNDEKIFSIGILNDLFASDGAIANVLNKVLPQERIPSITVTAVDKDGNEVKCFDKNAQIDVRFGATPAIERNINLILNDEERLFNATSALNSDDKEALKNLKSLEYYLSFSVMTPASTTDVGGNSDSYSALIPMNEKEFARIKEQNEGLRFKVDITFDSEKVQKASEFVAIGYGHSTFKFVAKNEQEIKDGDEDIKMTIFLNDVSTVMSVGILSDDSFKNMAFYVAAGILGVIALILIVWAVTACLRRKKYRIKYKAEGGRFCNGQRVKLCKKPMYPENPVRKGYRFMGWYLNKRGTKKFDLSSKLRKKHVTVYAKWLPDSKCAKLDEIQENITKKVASGVEYRGKARGYAATGVRQAAVGYDEDPRITKLEIEKLNYEAKKAEEERKAEEVRLQTLRELEAAKNSNDAKAKAEEEAEKAKLALQQALAEREALISLAKAEERARVLEELRAAEASAEAKAKAEEEAAQLKSRVDALEKANGKIDEDRVNELVDSKLKEYDEARAKELALNAALLAAKQAEEKFNAQKVYAELKAELLSYKSADDLDFGLCDDEVALSLKVENEVVVLETKLDADECAKKGFKVEKGLTLASRTIVSSNDGISEAKELIEETLYAEGYLKTERVSVDNSDDGKNGFELKLSKGRTAETVEEMFKIIRVYAKSFVSVDDEDVAEKTLMKAFVARGKIYMYLNYFADGMNAVDGALKSEGFGSFIVVSNVEECKNAIAAVGLMMRENGLVRCPSATSIKEDSSEKGFTYTLKA